MKKTFVGLLMFLIIVCSGHAVNYIDCNGLYSASAGANTVQDITTENFSISFWAKLHSTSTAHVNILGKGTTATKYYAVWLLSNSVMYIDIDDGPNRFYVTSSSLAAYRGVWAFYTVVIDRATDANCKIYANGVDVSSSRDGTVASVGSITNTSIFNIGNLALTGLDVFTGSIYDVKMGIGQIWTPTQITYQMNNPLDVSASAGTITEYWGIQEGSGTDIKAGVSTPTNDLTLSNALAWASTTQLKKMGGIAFASVKKVGAVAIAGIKKLAGVQ